MYIRIYNYKPHVRVIYKL